MEKFIGEIGIVPVVAIDDAGHALALGDALMAGDIPCIEITFRTAAAEETIRRISAEMPDMVVGAGTVLSVDQAKKAIDAGARFIVSPGFDGRVVEFCMEQKVPIMPGVATPSEIMMAMAQGLDQLKFFPAEALGGMGMLKALSAPFSGIKFIPTGGISSANLAEYLAMPQVLACGGSWLASRKLIAAQEFGRITALSAEARRIVVRVREEKERTCMEA